MTSLPPDLPGEIARQLQYYEQAVKAGKARGKPHHPPRTRSPKEQEHLNEQKEQQYRF
jgi:hypothetical protein